MNLSKNILEKFYVTEKKSVSLIARNLKCSEHKINYWLAKFKIAKRSISDSVYLYHNPKGDPFKMTGPKNTEESFLSGLGLGLYWGEGTKSNKNTVRLGNTDPVLIKKFIDFLIKICGVKKKDIRFGLQIFSDTTTQRALKFWQNKLLVPRNQFFPTIVITPARNSGTYRHKAEYGVLTVYYGNKKLRDILCQTIKNMK